MPYSDKTQEETLRERLREVSRRYPQAEIARRLNIRRSTVNRYLLSNRIPGAFLAAVSREFGVNANWLMLGEGVPWIADVRADQAALGKNLLELVQAMERVSRLRLGALAGNPKAASLRELSDAMESHERLGVRLAEKSRATYWKILEDWNDAVHLRNIELSNQLARAAAQIERLCPDAAFRRIHEALRAAHEMLCGRTEASLVHRKNVFAASVGDSGKLDERGISAAVGLAVSLDALSRTHEARAVLLAALNLGFEWRDSVIHAHASAFLGWTDLELGFVARGMRRLHAAMARVGQNKGSENLRLSIAYGNFVSGCSRLNELQIHCAGDVATLGKLRGLSPWCLEMREVEDFARQCEPLRDSSTSDARILRAHLLSIKGRHAAALACWHELANDHASNRGSPAVGRFAKHALLTHLLIRAQRTSEAREALMATENMRKSLPPEVALDCHWLRLHWRNAVLIEKPKSPMWRAAARFSRLATRRGLVAYMPAHQP